MALKGNLRDFSTTQLLNLISLARKSGSLIVEGPSQVAQLAFRNGKLVYAQMGQEDCNLTTILQKAGKLNSEQARVLRERAGQAGDKELGLLLINAGYVSQADILLTTAALAFGVAAPGSAAPPTKNKGTSASANVTERFPVADPPHGTSPSRFMKRMKKKSVRMYGTYASAPWPMLRRTTSSRK